MNYYERHIGDYLKDTAHLSLIEHGIYTRLLDVYYTKETGFSESDVARLIGARSKEEKSALQIVLQEFFFLVDGAYHQSRCDREIKRYKDKQEKARSSANARWKNDSEHTERNANAMRTHTEGNAPQSPVTSNQTPITNTPSSEGVARTNEGAACIAMKSAGMASVNPANPKLTELLKAGITVSELADAASDAVSKGKSFAYALATAEGRRRDAATAPLPTVQRQQPKSFAERDREAGWARWEETTNRVHPDRIKSDQKSGHVIDISPLNLEIAQ